MAAQVPANGIQLDESLTRRIDDLARSTGRAPIDIVREAVEEFAARHNGEQNAGDSAGLWDIAAQITATVPEAEWAKLPTDLAKNFEHYRYGYPRED